MNDAEPRYTGPSHVLDDMPCFGCGYNLRTLELAGDCPECGHPIALTLAQYTGLPDPAWLRRVRWGVDLILIANFLLLVLYITGLAINTLLPAHLVDTVMRIGVVSLAMVLFAGAWLVVSPDPKLPPNDRPRRARWITRVACVLLALVWPLSFIYPLAPLGLFNVRVHILLLAAFWFISGIGVFALGRCLRSACMRLILKPKDLHLSAYCGVLGVLMLFCGALLSIGRFGIITYAEVPFAICLFTILSVIALLLTAFIRLRYELTHT